MRRLKRSQFAGVNQHYRNYRFEEYLDNMVRCGIQSLEMWCGAPHYILDPYHVSDISPLRRMASERGLKFVSLTTTSMQWQHQFGAPGKERQKLAVDYYKNGVRVAAELGCPVMSINSGWGYWDESKSEGMKRSMDAITQVADFAQQQGVTLAMETLQPIESNLVVSLEDAKRYLEQIHHPAVKVMIDLVAIGVAGETVEQWFEAFGENMVHCHLADGAPSGHRAFGEGEYPLAKVLQAFERYDYKGSFNMELGGQYMTDPFSADQRNMAAIRRFLED